MKKRTIIIPLLALLIWCLIIAASEGWRVYQENHLPGPSELAIYYDTRDLVEAFAIEGIRPEKGVNIQTDGASIDESELQLRILGYNYACREGNSRREPNSNHQDITLEQIIEQLNLSNLETQINPDNRSTVVKDYIDWYKYDVHGLPSSMDPYRDKLFDIYRRYIVEHPEFDGKNLNKLTPTQIKELAKKERDPSYELNLT